MHWLRTASVISSTLIVVLLSVPAYAGAATAPTLQKPEANAPAATEGASLEFEWSGTLQGDADALDRSFFRLEIIKASEMPSGAQSEWPTVENFFPTEPGQATTSASVGVPSAGEYRWRVCAWGVLDDVASNVIAQLPGGCSAARAFSTVAAATTSHAIGELKMGETNQVAGATRTVVVKRPAPPAPAEPVEPAIVEPTPAEPLPPATFSPIKKTNIQSGGTSALGLGTEGLKVDTAASREGLGGAIMGGLSSNLPLIPIPFWTLALLLACFPLLRLWRRDVLGMFEWSDGSINGSGTYADVVDDLSSVPLAQEIKVGSMTADGTAAAPAPVVNPLASDRGRRAA
ncbi:MAG: hypothetical protein JWL76_2387 [Thermoleophilia bacterium]|nr:hypothetical protein [Thermoleophilia bacterium]